MRGFITGLALAFCGARATTVEAQPPAADASRVATQVSDWIGELAAREFDSRDRAMQALIGAGPAAIEPVLQVAQRRDQEVATRAVMVLKGIGERGDIDSLEAALSALTRVAQSSANTPIVRRAVEARERLESIRQDRAIEFFRSRGALVNPELADTWVSVQLGNTLFSLELGPGWQGTDKDLERLKWCRDVEQVCLVGPKATDAWVRHLRDMPRLFSVKVKHANLSVRGIEELAQFERLRILRLMFLPLGDELVSPLEKSQGLVRLIVISRTLTDDGERRLKAKFNDKVECPRGALLGVRAGTEEPWSIREVVAGSAADKASLKVDDRIISFNGQKVATFAELRQLIAKCAPGDSATLDVERGDEVLPLKVTFGEWD